MNILIVEDDYTVAHFIKKILSALPCIYHVDIASGFEEGFTKAFSNTFDLIIIDILLKKKDSRDGIELCRCIRQKDTGIPLIIVTSCIPVEYLEKSFQAGANDYITKPFHPKELQIRIQQWIHFQKRYTYAEKISYRGVRCDLKENRFFFQETPLKLGKKQKKLLLLFLQNPEKILSHHFIQEKIWSDHDTLLISRNIRSCIYMLRETLASCHSIEIKNIHGEGYMLCGKETSAKAQ